MGKAGLGCHFALCLVVPKGFFACISLTQNVVYFSLSDNGKYRTINKVTAPKRKKKRYTAYLKAAHLTFSDGFRERSRTEEIVNIVNTNMNWILMHIKY